MRAVRDPLGILAPVNQGPSGIFLMCLTITFVVLGCWCISPALAAVEETPAVDCCPAPTSAALSSSAQSLAPSDENFFVWLFDTSGFPPRWHCGIWSAALGWLHIISDISIWAAYMAIPMVLGYFLYKRKIPLPMITWLFIAFIASCGFTHLFEAIIFWHPVYRLAGVWKLVTALVSWLTVLALIPLIPRAIHWPDLDQINRQLRREVSESRDTEAEIRQIIEAAPVGMLLVDDRGLINLANREIEVTFGYTPAELIGQPVEMLIPHEHRAAHPKLRAGFFAAPVARRMGGDRELYGLQKDGTKVPLDIGLKPITTSAGPFVLASIVDISAQKLAALRLKELNLSLEHKNTELEQFVYTASHDLKSPLVSIQGFAGLIQSDLDQGRTDRLTEHLDWIIGSVTKLRTTIDDLLELTRIGQASSDPHPIDVNALVSEVISGLERQVKESNAIITIAPDLPAINMDRVRLYEIFQNLISNALKYGRPKEGEFRIEIGGMLDGSHPLYYVADNGDGIPIEYHDKIFGLFERLTTDEDGTGVGLAIVKRVVQVHGGNVRVESQPGQGTKFIFDFPPKMLVKALT